MAGGARGHRAARVGPLRHRLETTEFRDEVLGRLGGVLRGTVMQFQADRGFFVADVFWLPPDGDPIGPMAFEVACTPAGPNGTSVGPATHLRITQQGQRRKRNDGGRDDEVIGDGWERALAALKALLEK